MGRYPWTVRLPVIPGRRDCHSDRILNSIDSDICAGKLATCLRRSIRKMTFSSGRTPASDAACARRPAVAGAGGIEPAEWAGNTGISIADAADLLHMRNSLRRSCMARAESRRKPLFSHKQPANLLELCWIGCFRCGAWDAETSALRNVSKPAFDLSRGRSGRSAPASPFHLHRSEKSRR